MLDLLILRRELYCILATWSFGIVFLRILVASMRKNYFERRYGEYVQRILATMDSRELALRYHLTQENCKTW
jgi:hypothetical protein